MSDFKMKSYSYSGITDNMMYNGTMGAMDIAYIYTVIC